MRLLDCDKKPFWYANYIGRQMLLDSNGYPTGERSTEYDTPTKMYGTISTPTGAATAREFGTYIDYDFILHIEDLHCPFDENAAIWLDHSTDEDPDYKVMRIAECRTHTAVAIRQVR